MNKLLKILIGNTETPLVSGYAKDIVFSKNLSSQIYDKIDSMDEFVIYGVNNKYKIKLLK